jgi:hypothetical protein
MFLVTWSGKPIGSGTTPFNFIVLSTIACTFVPFRKTGGVQQWYRNSAPEVQRVSETVCGPLLRILVDCCEHVDSGCADLFRYG